jgi:hypothetical protein
VVTAVIPSIMVRYASIPIISYSFCEANDHLYKADISAFISINAQNQQTELMLVRLASLLENKLPVNSSFSINVELFSVHVEFWILGTSAGKACCEISGEWISSLCDRFLPRRFGEIIEASV